MTDAFSDGLFDGDNGDNGDNARRRLPLVDDERPSTEPPSAFRRKRRTRPPKSETEMRYVLASILRVSDRIVASAVRAYDRLFELDPEDEFEIYLQMGLDFAQSGRSEEAQSALRKAIKLRPEDLTPRLELARIYLKKHAPQAAIQVLEEAKAQGHKSYRLHKQLADAWLQDEKLEEAAFELEEALRQKPDVPDTCYQLGVLLDRIGEHDRAIAVLEHAISLKPNEVGYHQSLGFALESAGRRPDAIRAFKRALELEHRSNGQPTRLRQGG